MFRSAQSHWSARIRAHTQAPSGCDPMGAEVRTRTAQPPHAAATLVIPAGNLRLRRERVAASKAEAGRVHGALSVVARRAHAAVSTRQRNHWLGKGWRRSIRARPADSHHPRKSLESPYFKRSFSKKRARARAPSADGRARFRASSTPAFDVALVGISRLMGPFFSGYSSASAREPSLAMASFSGYATVYR